MTKQRRVIMEVLRRNRETHPTAEQVYSQVRQHLPSVSLGTIYRNLKVLTEMGELREVPAGAGGSRYDVNTEDHYEFICDSCGRIFDLPFPVDQNLVEQARSQGYEVTFHRVEFRGQCPECQGAAGESRIMAKRRAP